MNSKMDVPGLAHWGVSMADAAATSELVDKSQVSSSMQGNPIKLTGPMSMKNPDFLLKNPDLLIRNLVFLLKHVDFIIQQTRRRASW